MKMVIFGAFFNMEKCRDAFTAQSNAADGRKFDQ
jgi:hypothetical protein